MTLHVWCFVIQPRNGSAMVVAIHQEGNVIYFAYLKELNLKCFCLAIIIPSIFRKTVRYL